MSAAAVLPFVWATATPRPVPSSSPNSPQHRTRPVEPQMGFYRKYTEAMLRRYVRMSMEAGKVPSLLGKEMFRGKVTSYRVESFEDVVIFLHDIDKCLERLDPDQQSLISRIALEEYTLAETAALLGLPLRTVIRRYWRALDRLTRIFLAVKLLEPLKSCQGGSDPK
jgi:RNA polymerase sigma factor (sigma-70 family)